VGLRAVTSNACLQFVCRSEFVPLAESSTGVECGAVKGVLAMMSRERWGLAVLPGLHAGAKHGVSLSGDNISVVGLTIIGDCPGDKSGM